MGSDQERRKRLASLPFSEKLKILEKLRERSRVIAASDLRKFAVRRQMSEELSKTKTTAGVPGRKSTGNWSPG